MRYWLLFLIISTNNYAVSPNSFAQAKKIAAQLFSAHPQTIYCQCIYAQKEVDLASCGMQAADEKKRAHRVEWEHIMAAEHFGQHFACWRTPMCTDAQGTTFKGRKCCEKVDPQFRHVEAELYNLWPEVGLVNQARSNYRFGVLPGNDSYYGCSLKIDKRLRRVEPTDEVKGIVARAYLFMSEYYHISLSSSQRQLLEAWNLQFAPTAWERIWAVQVAELEGYPNSYISQWGTQKSKS